ncbi:hypothetical protein PLESTB_000201500 [Pleodorina starrii]|uniref:Uncharacterized protein n=1 Tax=Pleodorina starrii TaxID=330485 RepID=A0A9W6EYP0_9CHLO|nr:hypothetical protein PLESTB_000201500 [Pleodorina starrii]GLC73469.1 hypothetical protein PLESTF_001381300 [Pleodorina starrii]
MKWCTRRSLPSSRRLTEVEEEQAGAARGGWSFSSGRHPDKHAPSSVASGAPSAPPGTSGTQSPLEATDSAAGAATTGTCTGGDDGSCPPPRSHTQAQATEHFKRLAAAYHVLLQASAAGASSGLAGSAAAGGRGAGRELDNDDEEEQLLDELSVELLLMEAQKLRLSDFDMLFLHQRASGGAASVNVWPEAAQSVDDVWRRIRRRVERRRKRHAGGGGGRGGAAPAGVFTGFGGGRPGVGAKWDLLSEFLVDILGATTASTTASSAASCQAEGGAAGAGAAVDGPVASTPRDSGPQQQQQPQQQRKTLSMQYESAESGTGELSAVRGALPAPERPRGRLPPGFYLRWLKRLVAARLLFFAFFKG